uniref:Uncharacterized protein n=1 Tax=Magallana gigas TaxID=29159 RepID=K1PJV0_MAGGI
MPRFSWAATRMSEDMENFAEDGCVMWELALTSKKQSRKKNNARTAINFCNIAQERIVEHQNFRGK